MKQSEFALSAVLALALAACQQPANDSNIAVDNSLNAAEVANADIENVPPSETSAPPPPAIEANASEMAVPAIPARYQGRWGLVPADCTSTRGDAKGLITISDTGIRFYEARATLKEQRPAIATAFSGLFAFSGEGQTWERVETLTIDGEKLSRSSTTPRGEEGEALTYSRCKA